MGQALPPGKTGTSEYVPPSSTSQVDNFDACSTLLSQAGSNCCRKWTHFQGPKVGSCLTLGNELPKEIHMLTKQETLLGRDARTENSRVREARRTALPCGSQSQVLLMGLVSRLFLANHSDSESFLVVLALFSQDGCQRLGFWEVVGHVVSLFDLS